MSYPVCALLHKLCSSLFSASVYVPLVALFLACTGRADLVPRYGLITNITSTGGIWGKLNIQRTC